MNSEISFVFLVILFAGALLASNRVRYDFVALLVVLSLVLSGTLTLTEGLSGFGNSVILLVACLLVLGEMLDRTGVAKFVGDKIMRYGGHDETTLIILIMISATFLGSVMSATAVVAIFIPIVLRIAAETGNDKSRLLMPMSYAALISGSMTLIASTPNLVVSDELISHGFTGFGFFSFSAIGLIILVFAVLYVVLIGRHNLGSGPTDATTGREEAATTLTRMWANFDLDAHIGTFEITESIAADGSALQTETGVTLIARLRANQTGQMRAAMYRPSMQFRVGDIILVQGDADQHEALEQWNGVRRVPGPLARSDEWIDTLGFADALVHPEAMILGKPAQAALDALSGQVSLVGIMRNGITLPEAGLCALRPGDRILMAGPWDSLDTLLRRHDTLVLLAYPYERNTLPAVPKGFWPAIGIILCMVLLSVFEIVPVTIAVLLAALASVLLRLLSAEDAYRAIKIPSLVIVGGMLPLADALEATGGSALIVEGLLSLVGTANPRTVMAAVFGLTAVMGLVLPNIAAAVLVAPIAITAAKTLGISPYPLALCVLTAASATFSSPVSTPVITLVVAPGGYRFLDFVKTGLPLTLLVGIITVAVAPVLFPY